MNDASLDLNAPRDKYNLVYLTFLLHGIGVLTPWNMFITADKVEKFNFVIYYFFCSILQSINCQRNIRVRFHHT